MPNFHAFAQAVKKRFDEMSQQELFVTVEDKDAIWGTYLNAFPEGSNPIYRVNTEHDCSCCRNFIKNIGNVVNAQMETIWDIEGLEYPYDVVARTMNEYVSRHNISGLFRPTESQYGAEKTLEHLEDGSIHTWKHFVGVIHKKHKVSSPQQVRGEYSTSVGVLKRGLEELTPEAFETVIDLIQQNVLYRGQEALKGLSDFRSAQRIYEKLSTSEKHLFVWVNATIPYARIRNTAIGTLLQDLSEGTDIESAVKKYEAMVAPANYKRPTALITPRMVNDAMKTIQSLDLEPALERRFAKLTDVSVNDVRWVDNSVQSQMKGGIAGLLMEAATAPVTNTDKAEDISMDDFVKLLPDIKSMEVLVKNQNLNNLVSITAPVHSDVQPLFKWGNNFAWSYKGNITDSIKEKVKAAGGNTSAKLRFSLAWFNYDDLDIHVKAPGQDLIYYDAKQGCLDVDMNAGCGRTREPVENVSFKTPRKGKYSVYVNQFSKRETKDVGFVIQTESNGVITEYIYNKTVTGTVHVGNFNVDENGNIIRIDLNEDMKNQSIAKTEWGVTAEQFTKVNTLMTSPNHWEGNQVGAKHWFFILDNCINDEATRGIYNEFLKPELDKHRKVFEVLGNKTMCQPTADQLSGVGFSAARNDSVIVRVAGTKLRKLYNIKF